MPPQRVSTRLETEPIYETGSSHFVEIICPAVSINVTDVLKEVREARNASVGHPTKLTRKGEVTTHFISRTSMGRDGFQLLSFSEKDGVAIRSVQVRA
jgi:hypothetical protein